MLVEYIGITMAKNWCSGFEIFCSPMENCLKFIIMLTYLVLCDYS